MSAAPRLNLEEKIIHLLEQVISGDHIHCVPGNPFYDLDLSVLVALDQVRAYSMVDPTLILGEREQSFQFEIWSLDQKQEILAQIEARLRDAHLNQSLIESHLICADELITNAIFNAPFSEKVDRKIASLRLPGDKPVLFALSIGEYDVTLSCSDPYGSIDIQKFFKKMLNCYKNGVGESINYGEGGAGIGCFMIFDQCLSLILGVVPGKRTSFHCRFPKKMSSKMRKSLPKNLIVFTRED